MKTKKIPMRMCVGCQEMKPKKELVRIVKNKLGEINVDTTGKMNGRGAYICPDEKCLDEAIKKRRLERAFGQEFDKKIYEQIRARLKGEHG